MSTVSPGEIPLDADVPCYQCHYNLRTRLPSQNCPECNAPIAKSIAQHGRWSALLYRPQGAAKALLLFGISGWVEVGVSGLSFVAPELFREPGGYIASAVIWFAALMGACVSVIWFVLSMRPRVAEGPGAKWRVSVLVLRVLRTVLSLVSMGVNGYVFFLYYTRALSFRHVVLVAASIGVHTPSMLVGVVIECIAFRYFLRLCKVLEKPGWTGVTIALFVSQMGTAGLFFVDDVMRTTYVWTNGAWFPGVAWSDLMGWHQLIMPVGLLSDAFLAVYAFGISARLRRLPNG